jgi:hypothetical protein
MFPRPAPESWMIMEGLEIRGLSLTRPWPFAFVAQPKLHGVAPKRIENRTWLPPRKLIGHFIALHAAKSWDEDDREFIAETTGLYVPSKAESPHSEIFAVCMLGGFVRHDTDYRLQPEQRKWFFGPYGWLIADFVRLRNPVPCTGAQGLWSFRDKFDVLAQLRKSYAESEVKLAVV